MAMNQQPSKSPDEDITDLGRRRERSPREESSIRTLPTATVRALCERVSLRAISGGRLRASLLAPPQNEYRCYDRSDYEASGNETEQEKG